MKAVGRTVFLSLGCTERGSYGVCYQKPGRWKWINTTHPGAVHGADLKPSRIEGTNLLLQFIRVGKGVVSKIHVALERECELAVEKESRRSWLVIEPMEYRFEWIQALIEGEHRLWGETIIVYHHLR